MSDEQPQSGSSTSFEGVLLRGRYRVDRKLGQGGMATVYTATDTELGRKVVVKVPLLHFMDREGFKERFELEVRGLVDTEHPHVVSILARGDHGGVPYFVIQFLKGGSLEDRIREKTMETREVLAWLPHVADALDFIHSRNIIHRDVKPGNILFDEAGNVFLSDFGVAKALGQDTSLTADGFTVGSPEYMAPEQVSNVDIGPATDQYALGVTVYESLAKKLPFVGKNALEILIAKGSKDPQPLADHGKIPPEISAVVMRSIARDPKMRFESCHAFAAAFEVAMWAQDAHTPGHRTPAPSARHTMGGSLDIAGETLLGHYKVGGRLGSGGMGTVYLAEDTDLGKNVVIKIPHPRLVAERGFLERFEREITQLLRLEHPSIVRVLARGDIDGFPFYVLQHLKGGSLSDRLKDAKDGKMHPEDVMSWFEATARALDFLHSRGLIHRDVKPGNILFDEHDHAYLSDFGIAKSDEEDTNLTTTNAGVGSPRYMAPEQVGNKFEGRADQYALATTVFEALAGRLPFPDGTALEIMIKKVQERPPLVSEYAPEVPREAAEALHRALSGDPDKRFPTCRALFLAFKRAMRGEGGPAPGVADKPAVAPPAPAAPVAAPINSPIAKPIAPAGGGAPVRGKGVVQTGRTQPRAPTQHTTPSPPRGKTGARTGTQTRIPTESAGRDSTRSQLQTPELRVGTSSGQAAAKAAARKRAAPVIRLWQPAFILAFLGVWLLARVAPFTRFVAPHDPLADMPRDAWTFFWAVGPLALAVAIGHGLLLHERRVTKAWAWMLATVAGGVLAICALFSLAAGLGDALPLHPLGVLSSAVVGLLLGVSQWFTFIGHMHRPWRWWVATTLAFAASGTLLEWGSAGGDALYLRVLAAGAIVAAAQLATLRLMAPSVVEQTDRSAAA